MAKKKAAKKKIAKKATKKKAAAKRVTARRPAAKKKAKKKAAKKPQAKSRAKKAPVATRAKIASKKTAKKATPRKARTGPSAAPPPAKAPSAPLQVGEQAPDFSLPSDAGSEVNLSDYRGQKVVLYFYPKDDTPGCTREACGFRDRVDQIRERGAALLGVSADPLDSHRSFRAKHELNFPLLSDETGRVARAYRAAREGSNMAERMTFIIDERGRIAKVFSKVSVDVHADQVLGSL